MRCCTILFLTLAFAACDPGPTDGAGEGEGEGEAGEGEGEGEAPAISYQWEDAAGAVLPDDSLVINHDSALGALDLSLGLRNTGGADFLILSDPPLLVSGDGYSVVTQPPSLVPANAKVDFAVRFAPAGGGAHPGLILFAYGVFPEERVRLDIEGNVTGAPAAGLSYAIYDGTFDLLPDFSTLTPVETGTIATFDISARVDLDFFAYTFDGNIGVDSDGDYTFFTTSDDGSKLFIDGAVVVDNDGLQGPTEVSGTVTLNAGLHPIRVEFFENAGGAVLTVEWQGPGVGREVIPAERLFLP